MSAQEKIHLLDPFQSANIVVHFIGDTLLDGTREIDYHWNPGWEICLTPYGRGIFRIDDTPYAVSGGHVFHTCASERHGGWPSAEDPVRILYVCLSPGPSPSPEWQAVFQGMEALAAPLARDVDDLTGLHLRLLRLADPAWTVTQVAAALGFTSIHHFSRAFRQVYGLPPNEMRGIQPRDVGML